MTSSCSLFPSNHQIVSRHAQSNVEARFGSRAFWLLIGPASHATLLLLLLSYISSVVLSVRLDSGLPPRDLYFPPCGRAQDPPRVFILPRSTRPSRTIRSFVKLPSLVFHDTTCARASLLVADFSKYGARWTPAAVSLADMLIRTIIFWLAMGINYIAVKYTDTNCDTLCYLWIGIVVRLYLCDAVLTRRTCIGGC